MTTIQTIGAIWSFIALCAVLFIRGAHRKPNPREIQRIREMETQK